MRLPAPMIRAVLVTALAAGGQLREPPAHAQFASTTPGLQAQHFPLALRPAQTLSRAEEALGAARLGALERTAISRGGVNTFLYALIHCLESGSGSAVDVEVAWYPGHRDEGTAMLTFLADYMRSGRPPGPSGSFAGEWDTDFNRMHLTQQGSHVTGTYEYAGGTIDGMVTGGVLRFRWTQPNNRGSGKFTLAPDGKSFTGSWSYGDNPDKEDNSWAGKRVGAVPSTGAGAPPSSSAPCGGHRITAGPPPTSGHVTPGGELTNPQFGDGGTSGHLPAGSASASQQGETGAPPLVYYGRRLPAGADPFGRSAPSKPRVFQPAISPPTDALAGVWSQSISGIGASSFILTPIGRGRYRYQEQGQGGATGTAQIVGGKFRIEWEAAAGWAGHAEFDIVNGRISGQGTTVITKGARPGTYPTVIGKNAASAANPGGAPSTFP